MVGRKLTLVVGLVIAVTLQCVQGQIPTSIQFSFGANLPTGDEAVAAGQTGGQTIFLPVMVNIEPSDALLQSDIVVGVTVTGGTATSGADFVLVRDEVTFDIGANNGNTISVPINIQDDLLVEGTETFTLTGSVVTTGTIATFEGGPATGTILDNDGAIFQFNPSSYTVDEDVAGGIQAVSLQLVSGTLATSIGIQVTVTGGTATAIVDFSGPNPGLVTFLAGDSPGTTRSTDFNIVNDNDLESDETILISGTSLSALGQFQAGGDTAVITIIDDDVAIFQFIPSTYTVAEDVAGGQQAVSLQLVSGTLTANVGIQITVTGGTATLNADFGGPNPGVVTFLAGDGPGTIRNTVFTIVNDNDVEPDETIIISGTSLSALGQFQAGGDTAVITITDDDVAIFQFNPNTYTVDEDVTGGTQAVSLQLISGTLTANIGIQVTVTGGTATLNADFSGPVPGVVTFLVGDGPGTTRSTVFTIVDDNIPESDETILISGTSLSPQGQFQAGGDTAVITITEIIFEFNPSTYTVAEDVAGGQQEVSLRVVSGTLTTNIGVQVTVTGGTATLNVDFSGPNPGVVTFLAGDGPGTSRSTVFTIVNDNDVEPDETILISGTSPLGEFQVGGDTAIITIINVSPPVNFQFSAATYNTGEGSPTVAVCVDASALFGRTFQVTVSDIPGTATGGGADYGPITCNPLVFSGTDSQECCNIPIIDDFLCEGIETFSVAFTVTGINANVIPPSTATVFIADNDEKTVGTDQPSYTVTEFEDPQLNFNVLLSGPVTPGPGRSCVVTITTVAGTALSGEDYSANILPSPIVTFTSGSTGPMLRSISILDDLNLEDTESFNLSLSTSSPDCNIPNPLVPVTILDDEDCTGRAGMPCDENAMCEELRGRDNFTCTCIPPYMGDGFMCSRVTMGDDPHFSIVLPSGKLLCYTVQGEHGFVFNLISNKLFHMNAMFVPDSRREEVTWLGSVGIIVQNSQYKKSNATYLRFETKGKKIYIGDKVTLQAKNIEKLSFNKGKMTVLESSPYEGFRYSSVLVDLQDVGLNFTIKFLNEHLDLFWHGTGKHIKESHGLIGQFFRKGVEIDTVRKILILPGKEPVPVMRRPVWSFMEREVADDQLCWTAMNPGYQGEGLIDGTYFDYLMNDILSTDFKFKKRQ